MKTTIDWLKTHLETDAPPGTIVYRLVMLGHDVEGVENRAEALAPFTVASVVSAERHPNADRLKVCLVDTGKAQVQVVCGAPNAHAGMKGVFAPAGTIIPRTGSLLRETVIRGVASRGMLCSAYELGLGEDHEGIIELPEDAPVGAQYASYAGLGDTVLDIKVTPNRADCLGVRGVARDLAASRLGSLKPLDVTSVPGCFRSPIGIHIEDIDRACNLTEVQKQKLTLAGGGDIKRLFDRCEIAKQKLQTLKQGEQIDQAVWQEINPVQMTLQIGLYTPSSLLYKSLQNTLTPEQRARYEAAASERRSLVSSRPTDWVVIRNRLPRLMSRNHSGLIANALSTI